MNQRLQEIATLREELTKEKTLLEDESRQEVISRINKGERFFIISDYFPDTFNFDGPARPANAEVYVKVVSIVRRDDESSNLYRQLFGIQFWYGRDNELKLQTGPIRFMLDSFRFAFEGTPNPNFNLYDPEKLNSVISEAEFLAKWEIVKADLNQNWLNL